MLRTGLWDLHPANDAGPADNCGHRQANIGDAMVAPTPPAPMTATFDPFMVEDDIGVVLLGGTQGRWDPVGVREAVTGHGDGLFISVESHSVPASGQPVQRHERGRSSVSTEYQSGAHLRRGKRGGLTVCHDRPHSGKERTKGRHYVFPIGPCYGIH